MIPKNLTYNGVSLSDAQYRDPLNPSHSVLTGCDMKYALSTKIEDQTLYHGEKAFLTTAGGRYFAVEGQIAHTSAEKRQAGIDYLTSLIRPTGTTTENPDKLLEWQDYKGRSFWCYARVFDPIVFKHATRDPIIDFSFTLYSETPQYYGSVKHTTYVSEDSVLGFGLFSGDADGVHLGYEQDGVNLSGATTIENAGNFMAGVIIRDRSGLIGNIYRNHTNNLRYGLSGVATNITLDTTQRPTYASDGYDRAEYRRLSGSSGFLLSPGKNHVSVTAQGISVPPNSVWIEHYDTYI